MENQPLKSYTHGAGQWASGRRLTSAQRERKRTLDRLRATKRRAYSDDRVANLESKLAKLSVELEAIRKREFSLYTSLRDEIQKPCHPSASTQNMAPFCPTEGARLISTPSFDPNLPFWASVNQISRHEVGNTHTDVVEPGTLDATSTNTWMPSGSAVENASDQMSAGNCQGIFNKAVARAYSLPRASICADATLNQDALIRGVLFGWNSIALTSIFFCPLWEIIRYLDKRMFRRVGTINRLCILRMIHSLLLCLTGANTFQSLPPWYRPRPSQYRFEHPLAADVLPWPGLRERAVLCHNLTQTNHFWTNVIYCFRFSWPYTIKDIVNHNTTTGMYGFSGLYDHHLFEIRMWKMDMDFFSSFPETYDDIIPAADIEWPIQIENISVSPVARYATPQPLPLPEELDEDNGNQEQLGQCLSHGLLIPTSGELEINAC